MLSDFYDGVEGVKVSTTFPGRFQSVGVWSFLMNASKSGNRWTRFLLVLHNVGVAFDDGFTLSKPFWGSVSQCCLSVGVFFDGCFRVLEYLLGSLQSLGIF